MASTPDKTLNGKVAFVGGASRNLGGLISTTLGAEGALVAVHYNSESSRAKAEDVVAQINKGPGEAFAVQADLTKVAEVERVFEEVLDRFGKLDYSINTAGMVLKKPLTEITEEEYDRMFAVNSKAAFFVMREAARRMDDGGKIITVVTSLLAAYTGLYPCTRAARPRSSTSPAPCRRSCSAGTSRSTPSLPARWTPRSSTPPRTTTPSPTTSPPR